MCNNSEELIHFIGSRRVVNFEDKVGPFLKNIYGIGFRGSLIICRRVGIPYSIKFKEISIELINSIDSSVRFFFKSESEVHRRVSRFLRLRIRSGTYRGVRLSQGLPSRGQRSRTNGRTIRALRDKILSQIKEDLKFFIIYYV